MEIDLDEIIKRIEFATDCDYAKFHYEYERGLREAIDIIKLYKEQNGIA